ncbi:aminotransferase class V-fold PLP-dependent enzyme [Acidobacteria bacterium AB60]|nr:aminotransferase class V-fold PLP-dependent enzyme [Acidobacteria bacterium AB60]
MADFQFKEARTPQEFEQIHRLNHQVFAAEIRQHNPNPDGLLVDRFHPTNRYFLALSEGSLAGMVSVHPGPEFSIASRLPSPTLLSSLRAPLEVRLLAVHPRYRRSLVLPGLLLQIYDYARQNRFSDLLISGIVDRVPMYRKMGFVPIGHAVPSGQACFVPMRLPLDSPPPELRQHADLYAARVRGTHPLSLLPGPVEIAPTVAQAMHAPPVSHRCTSFLQTYEETRSLLSNLMGGMHAIVLGGSGTLVNDAVAANLHACFGTQPGLVLSNGEFGGRLIHQAHCAGLAFRSLRFDWGHPWDIPTIERALHHRPAWIWAVHLETSTGVLNDLPRLLALARRTATPVAADCVSSLGAVDTHLPHQLFLASGVSGKALSSYAGLAFVFASHEALERLAGKPLCSTFDLCRAAAHPGPVSTLSTPLFSALHQALQLHFVTRAEAQARFAHHRTLGQWLRDQLRGCGLRLIASEHDAAPVIASFPLPAPGFARQCRRAGFRIAMESHYLRARQWGQIATMGYLDRAALQPLIHALRELPTPALSQNQTQSISSTV